MTAPLMIGIDISTARLSGALLPAPETVTALHSITTPLNEGAEAIVETAIVLGRRLLDLCDRPPQAIGIALDGLLDEQGMLVYAENDLRVLQNMPLKETLQQALGLPVRIENTVNAMALAEAHRGSGCNCQSVLYVRADVSIGGAFVYKGNIWHGAHAGAGQIGYLLTGWMGQKPIKLNERASGAGIATQYNMRSRKFRVPALDEIIQYAAQGDQLAIRVVRDGARMLGTVLSPVVGLIDPQRVVVGGMLANIGPVWWDEFERALRDNPLPALAHVDVQPAHFDDHAALIGTAFLPETDG